MMKPLRILVVEDEALLVMDMEMMAEDAGHQVVGTASSPGDVDRLDSAIAPDLAFVDMQLDRGTSGLDAMAVIRAKWAQAIIVFVTANPSKIPEGFGGAHGVIAKPFTRNGFASAMAYIHQGIADPPPKVAMPRSFVPAPFLTAGWTP